MLDRPVLGRIGHRDRGLDVALHAALGGAADEVDVHQVRAVLVGAELAAVAPRSDLLEDERLGLGVGVEDHGARPEEVQERCVHVQRLDVDHGAVALHGRVDHQVRRGARPHHPAD